MNISKIRSSFALATLHAGARTVKRFRLSLPGAARCALVLLLLSWATQASANVGTSITIDVPRDGSVGRDGSVMTNAAGQMRGRIDNDSWLLFFGEYTKVWISIQRASDGVWWNGGRWDPTQSKIYVTERNGQPDYDPDNWWIDFVRPVMPEWLEDSYIVYAHAEQGMHITHDPVYTDDQVSRVLIDQTAPTVTISSPTDGASYSASTFPALSGTVQDALTKVQSLNVAIQRSQDKCTWNYQPGFDAKTGAWSITSSLPTGADLTEGQYSVTVTASDQVGNRTNATISILIDRTSPATPIITTPADNVILETLSGIAGTVFDQGTGSGIAQVSVAIQRLVDNRYWSAGGQWLSPFQAWKANLSAHLVPRGFTPLFNWSFPSASLPTPFDMADGNFAILATATDRAGNSSSTAYGHFSISRAKPTVFIDHPTNGSTIASSTMPQINGHGRPGPGHTLARVDLYLTYTWIGEHGPESADWNGADWEDHSNVILPTTLTGTNWSYNGTLPQGANLYEGHYQILAYAWDNTGSSNWVLHHFYVDRTLPSVITLLSPPPNCSTNRLLLISGTAQDNPDGHGLKQVHLNFRRLLSAEVVGGVYTPVWSYWNVDHWQSASAELTTELADTNWISTGTLPAGSDLPSGTYMIIAQAEDKAGNLGSTFNSWLTVDQTPPTLTLQQPAASQHLSGLSSITGTASDNSGGSGLSRVEIELQRQSDQRDWTGSGWVGYPVTLGTSLNGGNWSCSGVLPSGSNLPYGAYWLRVNAYDVAGNVSSLESSFQVQAPNPAPVVTAISPEQTYAGHPAMTLRVLGSHFVTDTFVSWDGIPRLGRYVSDTVFEVTLSSDDLASPATHPVTLGTPSPGGGSSSTFHFVVTPAPAPNPLPSVTSLDPSSAAAGSPDLEVNVYGANFMPATLATWDWLATSNQFISSSHLILHIEAAKLSEAGSHQIVAFNPAPGGGFSDTNLFTVNSTTPPNNQCARAVTLASGIPFAMSTTNASGVATPFPTCGSSVTKGVWFTYTPLVSGDVIVSTCDSDFDTVLQIYTGVCGTLTPLLCNDDRGPACSARTASVRFAGASGVTYYLYTGGYNDTSGNLSIVATTVTSSDCAGAIPLTRGVPFAMSTADATGTASPAPTCGTGGAGVTKGTWFTCTPSVTGKMAVSTCGSDFDTVLQVYSGVCGAFTPLLCNDDSGPKCSGLTASVSFAAVAGATYYVFTGGYNGSSGNLKIVASSITSSECGGAIPLADGVGVVLSTTNATGAGDPIATCGSGVSNGLWFTYTPSISGDVAVSTCGSSFDTVLQIYTGTCGMLTPLMCDDDNGPDCIGTRASVLFPGSSGTTYSIFVGGYNGVTGNLSIVVTPVLPPAPNLTTGTSGSDFTVQWNGVGHLESATNLVPHIFWAYVTNGGFYSEPMTNPAKFFRVVVP